MGIPRPSGPSPAQGDPDKEKAGGPIVSRREAVVAASGAKVKARFKNIYLGSRFEIPGAVALAAAKSSCTPGWDGWFSDKTDKAFTEDEPGQGGESRVRETSMVLTKPMADLYSVNRATLGFGFVTGSERPDLVEGGCLAEPEDGAASAVPPHPSAEVKRVDVTRKLPSRSTAY